MHAIPFKTPAPCPALKLTLSTTICVLINLLLLVLELHVWLLSYCLFCFACAARRFCVCCSRTICTGSTWFTLPTRQPVSSLKGCTRGSNTPDLKNKLTRIRHPHVPSVVNKSHIPNNHSYSKSTQTNHQKHPKNTTPLLPPQLACNNRPLTAKLC